MSQNSIQSPKFDTLLMNIVYVCKDLYVNHVNGFEIDIEEFTKLVDEAKKEFNHESIQDFWNKEKLFFEIY